MAERNPELEGVVEGEQERGDCSGRGGGGRLSGSAGDMSGCNDGVTNGVEGASGRGREDGEGEGSGGGWGWGAGGRELVEDWWKRL